MPASSRRGRSTAFVPMPGFADWNGSRGLPRGEPEGRGPADLLDPRIHGRRSRDRDPERARAARREAEGAGHAGFPAGRLGPEAEQGAADRVRRRGRPRREAGRVHRDAEAREDEVEAEAPGLRPGGHRDPLGSGGRGAAFRQDVAPVARRGPAQALRQAGAAGRHGSLRAGALGKRRLPRRRRAARASLRGAGCGGRPRPARDPGRTAADAPRDRTAGNPAGRDRGKTPRDRAHRDRRISPRAAGTPESAPGGREEDRFRSFLRSESPRRKRSCSSPAATPSSPMDSNVLRVLLRLGYGAEQKSYAASYRSVREALAPELPREARARIEAYQLLRRHGQELCKRTAPRCEACPLRPGCGHARRRAGCRSKNESEINSRAP